MLDVGFGCTAATADTDTEYCTLHWIWILFPILSLYSISYPTIYNRSHYAMAYALRLTPNLLQKKPNPRSNSCIAYRLLWSMIYELRV